jgi:hypothetical protein
MFVIPLLSTTKLRFLEDEVSGKVFPVTGRTKLVKTEEYEGKIREDHLNIPGI